MRLLNFGSLNIDKVYRVPHFVRPGETISSESFQCFPGGKGLNQSVAAARAGCQVYHAGTVGQDGEFLLEVLRESGVDIRYVRKGSGVTGHALIQVADSGENSIILFGGSNYENDSDYVDQVLEQFGEGDLLMLQNEMNDLDQVLKKGALKGMKIMLNPSPMDEKLASMDLSCVSWLMLNETEGKAMTGEEVPEQILNVLTERYPGMEVILTLGEEGCVYGFQKLRIKQKAYAVKAVDTTAAGDTFTGYFAAAAAEGKPVDEALSLAARASAIAVTREGASVSIPWRREIM
ncbi:MAG: ribokinase [Fusicatenibacter sp.]|nr:ribokinase [Lachnospiraceae bacterium]MDY2936906.1 ribokinase [Fusicatenibacter sp.]